LGESPTVRHRCGDSRPRLSGQAKLDGLDTA